MRALRTQTERVVNGERERNGVESESEHIMDVLLAHINKIKKKRTVQGLNDRINLQ